jgi:hypothetical protein
MLKAHNVRIIDHRQIAELATRARAVPRKRAHLLLHEGPADPVQRLTPEEGDATATEFVKWITNAAPGARWSLTQRAVRTSRVIGAEVE